MEKFAGYGFNKSHAAAYSLLAYHTGWLKVHYAAEFFCANMTVEMDDTDKLKVLFEDARKNFGLSFEPPDVNRGGYRFEPVSDTVIRYGLGAVKGTGQQAIEAIVAAREGRGEGPRGTTAGPFASLFDFCLRVDRTRINKRTVDALIKAGAFDGLERNRAALSASIDRAFDFAAAAQANEHQGGLFDLDGGDAHGSSTQEPDLVATAPWGVREQLTCEKSALGFYLSGHLFDEVAREVRRFVRTGIAELQDSREPQTVAGIVSDFRIINGQRGRQAIFVLEDGAGRVEATASDALVQQHRELFKDDELLIATGRLQPGRNGFEARFIVQQAGDMAQARCRFGKYLRVDVGQPPPQVARLLQEYAPPAGVQGEPAPGLRVRLGVRCAGEEGAASAELQLGDGHRMYPSDAALAAWAAEAELGRAVVVYD
jgi:DNA polymerase-3 subunit alpha